MDEVGQGTLAGAGTGAATGMSIGGPWGALAGGIIGGAIGFSEGKKTKAAKKKADRLSQVPMDDPAQVWFLNRLQQQEKQMRAGTDATSAFASRNAMNVLSQTNQNIIRAAGGNALSGINGLIRSQNATNNAVQGIGANAAANANSMLMAQGGLIGDMAARRQKLAEYNRDLAYSEWVNKQQNLNNASSQAMGSAPSIGAFGGRGGMKKSMNSGNSQWQTMGTSANSFSRAPQQPSGYQPQQYQMQPDAQPRQPILTQDDYLATQSPDGTYQYPKQVVL